MTSTLLDLSILNDIEIKDYPQNCPCCGSVFISYHKKRNSHWAENSNKAPAEHVVRYECGSVYTAVWLICTNLTQLCKSRRLQNIKPKFNGDIEFEISMD